MITKFLSLTLTACLLVSKCSSRQAMPSRVETTKAIEILQNLSQYSMYLQEKALCLQESVSVQSRNWHTPPSFLDEVKLLVSKLNQDKGNRERNDLVFPFQKGIINLPVCADNHRFITFDSSNKAAKNNCGV